MKKSHHEMLLITGLIILLSVSATAQHIRRGLRFTAVRENAGLSNPIITSICEDKDGWLWVGTLDGLNRYDGYEFKVYRNVDGDSTSLFKNYVQAVFEDSRGMLWVSTLNSGLQYYDRVHDRFIRVAQFSRNNCQILDIKEDNDHNVWIAGVLDNVGFAASYERNGNTWKVYHIPEGEGGIYTILHDDGPFHWLGSRLNGVIRWDKSTGKAKVYRHDPADASSIPGNYIEDVARDTDGNIWVATRHDGLAKYQRNTDNFKLFIADGTRKSILRNDIMDLCSKGEYLWLAIENGGLSRINIRTEEIENIIYDKANPRSIINNSVWALSFDRANRLWVGSYAKGLCVLDPNEKNFFEVPFTIGNDLVNAVLKDSKGRLWIGGEDGVVLIEDGKETHFVHDARDPGSLSADPVQSIMEDHNHQIWLSTWNGGINRFIEATRTFKKFLPDPHNPHSLADRNVFSINETKHTNKIVACTFGGLHILDDEQNGSFSNIMDNPQEGDQLLLTACEDHAGRLWVGGLNGFYLYDLARKKVKRIPLSGDSVMAIGDRVTHIVEDSKNRLWVASSNGLFQRLEDGRFIRYSVDDGLPVNAVNAIQEDKKGKLWLGTTHGLVLFDPDTKDMHTYIREDGLNSDNVRERAISIDSEGYIYLGSNGVNVFHPDSIFINKSVPPVYFTDLRILNRSISPKDGTGILTSTISETKEITLRYDQTIIAIHYVGINFTTSNKNNYAYKLEGFDPDWNEVGPLRFATYTNLDPGTYTFRVRASNNDGLWNEKGASLIIRVLPPWWATWWFRSMLVLFVISAFALFYYIRTRNIRRINRVQEEIISHRTRQLQETNQELVKREEEIALQNRKLKEQAEELSAQNEELIVSQEEISMQRDLVYQQNEKLIETQNLIEQQKQNLETEVANRTKELVEYNRQLEQFAFISAHNLRSPVARIIGLGHLLQHPGTDASEREQIYPKLVHAAEELDIVIKDLNTILEIRKNNDLIISTVNLKQELNIIKENLEHEIEQNGVTIKTGDLAFTEIRTVKPYMDSILYNLISNAIKYRHPERKPVIEISTAVNHSECCISVSDNGLGIDTSLFQDKMFTLYSRFHSHVEGKGMGLYLVKTQVSALGGRIEVLSEVDKGTTFNVYFKLGLILE